MTARYLVADVLDGLATIPDQSVDLVITSPPFLALRSYLPADHPDKSKEIGSEATPAEFLDVMLRVTAELRRVLAPHGSICIELGDTYAGSGGDGVRIREGELDPLERSGIRSDGKVVGMTKKSAQIGVGRGNGGGGGWPLAKSKTLIPELYRIALAYGINPLTGQPSPAGQWRIRNIVTWCRPNPPVGALGDKWRPATSDLIVACTSSKRYWDDLATRKPADPTNKRPSELRRESIPGRTDQIMNPLGPDGQRIIANGGGAPLLDYWEIPLLDDEEAKPYGPSSVRKVNSDRRMYTDPIARNDGGEGVERYSSEHPSGAPLLDYWEIPPTGYSGSHYAVFPPALVEPCVKAMCPPKVCLTCGEPSRRIVENAPEYQAFRDQQNADYAVGDNSKLGVRAASGSPGAWDNLNHNPNGADKRTTGWTDCGHDNYRPGLILDPFAGSGATLLVATGHGHDAIGIDIDERNADLARERVGPFLFQQETV